MGNNISDEEENKPSDIALRSYGRLKNIFNLFKRNKDAKVQQSEDENEQGQIRNKATSRSSGGQEIQERSESRSSEGSLHRTELISRKDLSEGELQEKN